MFQVLFRMDRACSQLKNVSCNHTHRDVAYKKKYTNECRVDTWRIEFEDLTHLSDDRVLLNPLSILRATASDSFDTLTMDHHYHNLNTITQNAASSLETLFDIHTDPSFGFADFLSTSDAYDFRIKLMTVMSVQIAVEYHTNTREGVPSMQSFDKCVAHYNDFSKPFTEHLKLIAQVRNKSIILSSSFEQDKNMPKSMAENALRVMAFAGLAFLAALAIDTDYNIFCFPVSHILSAADRRKNFTRAIEDVYGYVQQCELDCVHQVSVSLLLGYRCLADTFDVQLVDQRISACSMCHTPLAPVAIFDKLTEYNQCYKCETFMCNSCDTCSCPKPMKTHVAMTEMLTCWQLATDALKKAKIATQTLKLVRNDNTSLSTKLEKRVKQLEKAQYDNEAHLKDKKELKALMRKEQKGACSQKDFDTVTKEHRALSLRFDKVEKEKHVALNTVMYQKKMSGANTLTLTDGLKEADQTILELQQKLEEAQQTIAALCVECSQPKVKQEDAKPRRAKKKNQEAQFETQPGCFYEQTSAWMAPSYIPVYYNPYAPQYM